MPIYKCSYPFGNYTRDIDAISFEYAASSFGKMFANAYHLSEGVTNAIISCNNEKRTYKISFTTDYKTLIEQL